MTAVAMLELKQQVSRLTKSQLHELSSDMDRLRNYSTRRKAPRVKMHRDPGTGLPYFTPP